MAVRRPPVAAPQRLFASSVASVCAQSGNTGCIRRCGGPEQWLATDGSARTFACRIDALGAPAAQRPAQAVSRLVDPQLQPTAQATIAWRQRLDRDTPGGRRNTIGHRSAKA